MPQLGYGVFQAANCVAERCVSDALSIGYRMINTAQIYGNEEGVGNAIIKSGIARGDVFIVSMVWISDYGYEKTQTRIDKALKQLKTDYIDLMLLHQPFCDRYGAYRALEKAYYEGKLRAIGVSNFLPDHLIDIASNMEIKPMVNQLEQHVFCQQDEIRKYMDEFECKMMAWGPLAEGRNNIFKNKVLADIGIVHNKTVAQIALRYLLQRDVVIIPKSAHKERMMENFNIFDFELTSDEMMRIHKLDTRESLFWDYHSAETTKFILGWR